jgi:hypothetical protein
MIGGVKKTPPPGRDRVLVLVMALDVVMSEVGDGRHDLTTPVMRDRQAH